MAAGWGALVAGPFAILDHMSHGHLWNLMFRFNAMPWHRHDAWLWISAYAHTVAPAVLIALLGFRTAWRRERLWALYLAATTLTIAGAGRVGAYYNHFLPFHAALAVVAALALSRWVQAPSRGGADPAMTRWGIPVRWMTAAAAGAFVLQVGVGLLRDLPPTLSSPWGTACGEVVHVCDGRLAAAIAHAHSQVATAAAVLAAHPGPLVAENMGLPVLVGRPAVLCDPITLFTLAEMGLWDERPFLDMVRRRAYGAILLQELSDVNPRFPVRVLRVIEQNYAPVAKCGRDYVLVPRTNAPGPRRVSP